MKKAIFIAALLCAAAVAAEAQQAVRTIPLTTTTTAVGGSITTGNAFQSVLAANSNRHGCMLQNTSAHTLYVFAGANTDATTAKSMQISPGNFFYCPSASGGTVIGDNISVTTSTAGDTYVMWSE